MSKKGLTIQIHSFISNGGARTSVWVQWSEVNVSYEAPSI